ncbi:MAG TPA: paclitaxel/taxanoid biosynthesis susceptibility protein TS1, partial [Desulfosporosinus sp.]|nr:paclitaxel/taxanoid biosynthesis susceptibility protein TS1 [Desulfosporosinus sp.]
GETQVRSVVLNVKQIRRNNRALEYFYDAKFIDIRSGEKVSGQTLFSGRRVRNRELNGPSLKVYRGRKLSKGRRSIRKTRYSFQPGDVVRYGGKLYTSKGIQNLGAYIRLGDLAKPVKTALVQPYRYAKGMFIA